MLGGQFRRRDVRRRGCSLWGRLAATQCHADFSFGEGRSELCIVSSLPLGLRCLRCFSRPTRAVFDNSLDMLDYIDREILVLAFAE